MSSESRPITADAFADALAALPLSSVYAKTLEIQNSVLHLERSNAELKIFIQESADGDRDCEEAIIENEGVIARMNERLELLKVELEGRGQKWIDLSGSTEGKEEGSNTEDGADAETSTNVQNGHQVDQDMSDVQNDVTNGESTASPADVDDARPRQGRETNGTDEGVYL